MNIPEYKAPLPKGASKEAVELSKEVNKWANIESRLFIEICDLEMLIKELGEGHKRIATLKAILEEKEIASAKAEAEYDKALHKMCEAL